MASPVVVEVPGPRGGGGPWDPRRRGPGPQGGLGGWPGGLGPGPGGLGAPGRGAPGRVVPARGWRIGAHGVAAGRVGAHRVRLPMVASVRRWVWGLGGCCGSGGMDGVWAPLDVEEDGRAFGGVVGDEVDGAGGEVLPGGRYRAEGLAVEHGALLLGGRGVGHPGTWVVRQGVATTERCGEQRVRSLQSADWRVHSTLHGGWSYQCTSARNHRWVLHLGYLKLTPSTCTLYPL